MFGKILKNAKSTVMGNVKKFANKSFLDAVVASCALVAFADGDVSTDEKAKMLGYIERSEELKVFKASEVKSRFTHFIESLEFDLILGKKEAYDAILKVRENSEEAFTCVALACAIGKSDGNFDKDEINVVKEIAGKLGIATSELGI